MSCVSDLRIKYCTFNIVFLIYICGDTYIENVFTYCLMFRLARQTIPLQVRNDNSSFHIFYSEIASFKNINLKLHNLIIINKNRLFTSNLIKI